MWRCSASAEGSFVCISMKYHGVSPAWVHELSRLSRRCFGSSPELSRRCFGSSPELSRRWSPELSRSSEWLTGGNAVGPCRWFQPSTEDKNTSLDFRPQDQLRRVHSRAGFGRRRTHCPLFGQPSRSPRDATGRPTQNRNVGGPLDHHWCGYCTRER